ncbi:hypothetical protein VNO80_13064 [Phaseolus coccineus]|uniref:Pectate lyase domain-containing protein n=1 Tax=Phaseolus coccineus TaxID=3886 RepID=A0AAN9N2G2_PHACN
MNVIDRCWRPNPEWRRHRSQLAACSVGYAGKMINNMGDDLIHYKVIDSSDDPINPKPKTLRKGDSIRSCRWDAIRLVTASKIWIDHNTLHDCQDGLLDVTRGSTNVTISNNWFKNQDKVMLLGHDDGYVRDKNMKVTVVYNHFGPNCNQLCQANNLYQGWLQYAIGGSMKPSLKSEANIFVAPTGNKVIWRKNSDKNEDRWDFYSIRDTFENGASLTVTKGENVPKPNYNKEQNFEVVDAKFIKLVTRSSDVLR